MSKMTLSRLDNYFTLAEQKSFIEAKYILASVDGADTSPLLSKQSDVQVLQQLYTEKEIKTEYRRICYELKALKEYIYSIPDETIRAIAIKRFVFKQSYKKIAAALHYSRGSIYRMLSNYIEKGQ